jgi:hypothetical protein
MVRRGKALLGRGMAEQSNGKHSNGKGEARPGEARATPGNAGHGNEGRGWLQLVALFHIQHVLHLANRSTRQHDHCIRLNRLAVYLASIGR